MEPGEGGSLYKDKLYDKENMTGIFQRQKWKWGWNEMSEEDQKHPFFKSWGDNI